ncbi:MAG: hypothetical protein QM761_00215 [Pseudoxanthomonas sp.]
MLKPLTKYWFSATDAPPNEARLPNAASPRTVPGASSATAVVFSATGIRLICSAVSTVVDSTEDTSIGLTKLDPTTVTASSEVASPPPVTKSTLVATPTLTLTLRLAPEPVVTVYWPVGSAEKR